MRKPDPEAPLCDCDHLWQCSKDPENPIIFDAEMNEFHLKYGSHSIMIYYCHFCGGRAPADSKRASRFTEPTVTERIRLMELTQNIKTLDQALEILGPPDHDFPVGESWTEPAKDDQPETTVFYRNLSYHHLSDTAEVRVRVYPTDRVQFRFVSKYVRPEKNKS
ncbi:MAG: hypothetical protein HC904_17270 [Blastochloris sp.]|nr:hypothetical protein [Blastochloris sp.]